MTAAQVTASRPWTATDCRGVTASADPAHGHGWANAPIWVIWAEPGGQLHQACIQPAEQSAAMHALYGVSAAAHTAMTAEVSRGR